MRKVFIASSLIFSAPAMASEGGNKFYSEAGLGIAASRTDLNFHNPAGTSFTLNDISADRKYISLTAPDNQSNSLNAYAAVGYQLARNISVSVSYRYLGTFWASGSASFPGAPPPPNVSNNSAPDNLLADQAVKTTELATTQSQSYAQILSAKAHAAYLGIAAHTDLSPKVFAEATGDLGIAFVRSSGTQGRNLGGNGAFPRANHANLSWAVGAGIGYRTSDRVSLIMRGKYFDAGKAHTGTTTNAAHNLGMNANERLETKLKATAITMGVRFAL